MFNTL